MPGSASINKKAKEYEENAMSTIPWTHEMTRQYGPTYYQFAIEVLFRFLMVKYGLIEHYLQGNKSAKVLLLFKLDGAALKKYLSHLLAGVKLVDARAQEPLTNNRFFLQNKYQTRDLCFPMKIVYKTKWQSNRRWQG